MLRVMSVMYAVTLAACLQSSSVQCANGSYCPSDRVCDTRGGCLFPQQLETCVGVADGTACSFPGVSLAECREGVCIDINCGNGRVDPDEVCDDGNTTSGDGCSSDCHSLETCGNGHVDPSHGE